MPLSSLYTIIGALAMYAFGLTMKNAEIRHTLKRIRDELSTARSEISSLNESQQKQIQDIEVEHQARIDELSNTNSDLQATLLQSHTHLNSLEQKLTYSKDECNARILLLNEKYQKDIEVLRDSYRKPPPSINGWT